MRFRSLLVPILLAGLMAFPPATRAQTAPERALRRNIPLTNMIRRAYAAGTRDSTGRPGRNYWQLKTDYSFDARLDPATATIIRISIITRSAGDWR